MTMTTTTTTMMIMFSPLRRLFVIILIMMRMMTVFVLAAEDAAATNNNTTTKTKKPIRLGMVSGSYDSEFFQQVQVGWDIGCHRLQKKYDPDIECVYSYSNWTYYSEEIHPTGLYTHACTHQMDEMSAAEEEEEASVDAMAVACIYDTDREDVLPSWIKASNGGRRPLVSFDGPPPADFPVPIDRYVGTDNQFLGRTMARLLKQLRPEGGTYGLLYHGDHLDRTYGFRNEILRDNGREGKAQWEEIAYRGAGEGFDFDVLHYHMHSVLEDFALQNPTAIVLMYQTPMREENYTDWIDEYTRPRNITVIGTDGSDYQLAYLSQRYVDGLVGQLPFDMGQFAAKELYHLVLERRQQQQEEEEAMEVAAKRSGSTNSNHTDQQNQELVIIPTNLVSYNLIPIELPKLQVDQSLLNNLVYTGFVCFGIVAVCSLGAMAWTLINRQATVVRASQPMFLCMMAGGVLLMSSALVPLSFDDGGDPLGMSETYSTGICMSVPWLAFTGFTVTFSALFSKTWRINRVFSSAEGFGRTRVSARDVMAPFLVLLSLNFTVLILWTAIDPLHYVREFGIGTDYWNREYQSIGTCKSEYAVAFLVPLACINFFVLGIACWQAWRARNIESEFSESKYMGLAVFSMTQAFLTGVPIVAVVRDIPEAFYIVLTFLIFILSMVLLFLIFLPKIIMQCNYSRMPATEQRKMIKQSVRHSSLGSSSRFETRTSVANMAEQAQNSLRARDHPSSMDSGFSSLNPISTYGIMQPKDSPIPENAKDGAASTDLSVLSGNGSGPLHPTASPTSSSSFLSRLLTTAEIEAILKANGVDATVSSDEDLTAKVANLLAGREERWYVQNPRRSFLASMNESDDTEYHRNGGTNDMGSSKSTVGVSLAEQRPGSISFLDRGSRPRNPSSATEAMTEEMPVVRTN